MQDATKVTTPAIEADRNAWKFGFTPQAELWNGRLAMIGFLSALLIELFSGQGVLHFWGLM
ncbi:chlorophyll a/b-binding protein [Leptothermofonsia sp. ETS-13]|uniref:chlorophyll a/b-binding protein n=1 Tax=Leptothermofonsia sp. ETS-13 TaxID=3035696 RepID=UPI003B9EF60D